MTTSAVFIGTQNWTNRAWVGPFYPPGTARREMLAVYSRAFSTVEVQRSFYEMPTDPEIRDWHDMVTPGFRFAMRLPQQITHEKRLIGAEALVAKFLARVEQLREKLGPILILLPSEFTPSAENRQSLIGFLASLPGDFAWAVEFRQSGWLVEDVWDALRARNAACVLSEGRRLKRQDVVRTAANPPSDWLYVRWLGGGTTLTDFSRAQEEKSETLSQWASVLWPMAERMNAVYGYFADRFEGHAPYSARVFQRMMGQVPVDPENLRVEIAAP